MNFQNSFGNVGRPEVVSESLRKGVEFVMLQRIRGFWFIQVLVAACTVVLAPYLAHAQSVVACAPSQNRIIQVCDPDLVQFDSDSAQAYLTAHSLPATDSSTLFQYARTDLRNELRAFEFARLLDIVLRAPVQRTAHEQAIYSALESRVWQHEKDQYQAAAADRDSWKSNPCAWRPDADVASAYALVYDAAPFCVAQPFTALFTTAAQVPTRSYFLAAAQRNSYGKVLAGTTGGAAMAADTAAKLLMALGFAAIPTTAAASGMGAVTAAASVSGAALLPFGAGGAASVAAGIAAAVPVTMAQLAMATNGIAALQPFQGQATLDQLAQMDSLTAAALANPPDLSTFARNQTGLYKLLATFTEMTVPEVASTAALASHRSSDLNFLIQIVGQPAAQESPQLTYTDWNGGRWMVNTFGGWEVQRCFNANCAQSDIFSPAIDIVDGAGTNWVASRVGINFLLTKQSPAGTDRPCPANAQTGLSSPADQSKCSSVVVSTIQTMGGYGLPITARLTQPPVFTTQPTSTFTIGYAKAKTFTIAASGIPLPSITLLSGTLPNEFSFSNSSVTGAGTAALSNVGGAPGIPPANGTYNIVLQAQNATGTTTQAFTIVVGTAMQITSPATAHFTYGQPGSFTVTTSGPPPIQLSADPLILPAGLSFKDNGDGTATISGTASDRSAPVPCVPVQAGMCGITATGANLFRAFQTFQIAVDYAPQPVIASANNAIFIAGRPNNFLVTARGATTPVDFSFPCGAPSWLSLKDNHDGTALVSATPPIEAGAPTGLPTTYRLYLWAHAAGSGVFMYPWTPCGDYPPDLTLNVLSIPMFTSPDSATLTAGQSGSTTVASDVFSGNPLVSYIGVLPAGTSFTPQHSAGTVAGTPVLSGALPTGGAGGDYALTFSVWGLGMKVNGDADSWQVVQTTELVSATQQFDLRVNQPPAIIGATDVDFTSGVPNTFTFATTGFPQLPANGQPGMSMSYSGTLPAGIAFSEVKPAGLSTGVYALSGTPAATPIGPFSIALTATNGVGTAARQTFTVHVIKPGDVNGDGQVDCSDINIVKAAMGTYRDRVGYDFRADANNDGVVDALDFAYVTSKLTAGTVCQ